jgi:hypothetical protein
LKDMKTLLLDLDRVQFMLDPAYGG